MDIMNKYYIYAFGLLSLLFSTSCSHEDILEYEENTETRKVGEYIKNNFDLTLFYTAMKKTGLVEELSSNEIVTAFVPNNKAFNSIGIYRDSDFDKLNQDSLKTMLSYCIFPFAIWRADVPLKSVDTEYKNKAGKEVFISIDNYTKSKMYINGVTISYSDIKCSNGVLHIINAMLKYDNIDMQEFLSKHKEYTCFVAALKKFGYWDKLKEEGPWTLVAPDNDAFNATGLTVSDIENLDPSKYRARLFGGYLFKTRLFMSDLQVFDGTSSSTLVPIENDEIASTGLYGDNLLIFKRLKESRYSKSITLSPPYRINYLINNGVVHRTSTLLFQPDEALLTTNP